METVDRIPPHNVEAEQSLLGSIMIGGGAGHDLMPVVLRRVGTEQVFYDPKHAHIWQAMSLLSSAGTRVDGAAVRARLSAMGTLDAAGGEATLAAIAATVPTHENVEVYLEIVWEKFVARRTIALATETIRDVYDAGGLDERLVALIEQKHTAVQQLAVRGNVEPKRLRSAGHFREAYEACFFRDERQEPGVALPINFRFKIREQEMTVVFGDDGAGKSTILGYFALHLAHQGMKACIVSMEMAPEVSLWIMGSQLTGQKYADKRSEYDVAMVKAALDWMKPRIFLYDFLGIGAWREIMDVFRYAATHLGVKVFVLDSVMRIGIPDDDYAQQAFAATKFSELAMELGVHIFLVMHENKGGDSGKGKIRGSKLWTANAHNVLEILRNVRKTEESGNVQDVKSARARKSGKPDEPDLLKQEPPKRSEEWDTKFVLHKQRYPGTQQNGSRYCFFDPSCFQVRVDPKPDPVNHLIEWGVVDRNNLPSRLILPDDW